MLPEITDSDFNLADWLRERARSPVGDRPALVTGAGAIGFRELNAWSARMGVGLRALGIGPEQRVVLHLDESAEFVAAFWAVLRIGAVAVPASPRLSGEALTALLDDSRARAVLMDAAFWPRIAPRRGGLRHLRHVVLRGEAPSGLSTLERLADNGGDEALVQPMRADDAACWLYTSGTTGEPKAAVHLHRTLAETALRFPNAVLGLTAEDLLFSAARMHFAYGLGNSILFPVGSGCAAAIVAGSPGGAELLEALERFRPTGLFLGPSHLRGLLGAWEARHPGQPDLPPPPGCERLRWAVSAGEALPEGLYHACRARLGVEVLDAVGSTENLTFYLANRPGTSLAGCSGEPVPGFELQLRDEADAPMPGVGTGTLWVRGPSAAAGYWNRRDRTRRIFRGPWLGSGDRFRRDEAGRYWFLGREDERFKVGGSWVAPLQVERALGAHPAVAQCAVVGARDADGLGQAVAYVVRTSAPDGEPAPSDEALAGMLRQHLSAVLAPHQVPARFEFRSDLPLTATGKVRRAALPQPAPGIVAAAGV